MILDVGCGHKPKGFVNTDLYIEPTKHRSIDQRKVEDEKLNIKNIINFVNADARYLPFRNEIFKKVFSEMVIEHIDKPLLMINEMLRCSKLIIVIICPHRLGDNKRLKVIHISFFNNEWFKKYCKINNLYLLKLMNYYNYYPHDYIPLIRIPKSIEVHISKRKEGS